MSTRIAPVAEITPTLLAQANAAAGGTIRAEAMIYRTLATYPALMTAWLAWGGHVARRNALTPALRELVILRTALLASGAYPTTQHVRIAGDVGIDDAALARVSADPSTADWDPATRAALCAVDQLQHHGSLDVQRWADVIDAFALDGTLDLIATVAFYRLACWLLNVAGTPFDDGQSAAELAEPIRWRHFAVDDAAEAPRVTPIPLTQWPQDLLADTAAWPGAPEGGKLKRFEGRPELRAAGVYSTLAHRPNLLRAIGPTMAHLLVDNALTDQQREIVIVRSCLHDRGAYPYRQHVRIASTVGVNDQVLHALTQSEPEIAGPAEHALLNAIDELHRTNTVSNRTWATLTAHLSHHAIMDAVLTAGFYGLISFALNAARTPLASGNVHLAPAVLSK